MYLARLKDKGLSGWEKPGGSVSPCRSQGWFCIQNISIVRFVRYRQGGALYRINLLAAKVIAAQLASRILCQAGLKLTLCTLN